jgi:hypothetical protein
MGSIAPEDWLPPPLGREDACVRVVAGLDPHDMTLERVGVVDVVISMESTG